MARIVLQPAPIELGLLGDGYELLQRDLEAQGHDVTTLEPEERRSVDPHTAAIAYTVAVAIYVSREISKPTLEEIGRVLRDRLVAHWRITRPRKALIYGEDGRVISSVNLVSEEPPSRT
jgi:hypothetical protein